MIYRLMHLLFGFDYVYWDNGVFGNGVARVFISGTGQVVYWRYKFTKVLDVIKHPKNVVWLTCEPEKYFDIKTKGEM